MCFSWRGAHLGIVAVWSKGWLFILWLKNMIKNQHRGSKLWKSLTLNQTMKVRPRDEILVWELLSWKARVHFAGQEATKLRSGRVVWLTPGHRASVVKTRLEHRAFWHQDSSYLVWEQIIPCNRGVFLRPPWAQCSHTHGSVVTVSRVLGPQPLIPAMKQAWLTSSDSPLQSRAVFQGLLPGQVNQMVDFKGAASRTCLLGPLLVTPLESADYLGECSLTQP